MLRALVLGLVGINLTACIMMSAPEVDYKGVIVNKIEPPKACAPKGNLVATADAAIQTIGDEATSLNREAMQSLIDQAESVGANYVYVSDHRQYSNKPKKGLVFRVVMKSQAFYCPSLDVAEG
ncbi:DUF4156 domain-containing protein [Litoribacillus peritrichatus]|uniref:Lipoprotein n=1 Tax=Litoribacillus peritrichatus TaxID=718191 RepID=A0ABP7NB11_9GAMM